MDKNKIKEDFGFDETIPIIDPNSETFKDELAFMLWSEHSCSDYRNDRERPYNGQSHTVEGVRGKTFIEGLTIRDVKDCLIKAMLLSSASEKYFQEFGKCWDFSNCDKNKDGEDVEPTQYLIDHQNESDFVYNKVQLGTWRPQDVYKINWDNIDPLAVCKNLMVEIEKMMGIYPNIVKNEL